MIENSSGGTTLSGATMLSTLVAPQPVHKKLQQASIVYIMMYHHTKFEMQWVPM